MKILFAHEATSAVVELGLGHSGKKCLLGIFFFRIQNKFYNGFDFKVPYINSTNIYGFSYLLFTLICVAFNILMIMVFL